MTSNESFVNTALLGKNDVPYQKNNTVMSGSNFKQPVFDNDKFPISIVPPDSYLLDDGANGNMGLQNNLCSKSCCSAQYPVPFKLNYDDMVCRQNQEFVPNNIMCNNSWQDSGCLCMTKNQFNNLANRGGNNV